MEIKVPEVGESVYEAQISTWHKKDGERVEKGDLLCELETDKISLELNADASGTLQIAVDEGETVKVGAVIGTIADEGEGGEEKAEAPGQENDKAEKKERKGAAKEEAVEKEPSPQENKAAETLEKTKPQAEKKAPAADEAGSKVPEKKKGSEKKEETAGADQAKESAPLGRAEQKERVTRTPMSPIRKRIAERLLAARQQTAMLTTFNEADMSRVMALRKKHQESFQQHHGVKLGLMSFFVKACVEALKSFPEINASIDGDDILTYHDYHIGIAIGAEKGLVVPVLRSADEMHFAEIEQAIADFAEKVENNKITLADLEGGTFTITNGGVYGSVLSTPIINPPQSAVLGMHAIQDRPVVRGGEIVIRPIMNLALSYDHRLIDGRQAVSFLKRIKDLVEEPEEMLLEL
ncbi:MAG: 2-oxoglutarate dehydrogenase complex dihydrolipoyllysine-residue succinyltransferase [Geoalkalibacter sp.]|jgi:2-oxoglutarate dehydrogenase E2 component (dihydrolipoamide succinyltransferase)|uniref:2-oxoglutarate dehydrogenase complex dihydrolipoyllysine-residue succinyltransferase n=1 Tax=Geoalkalibacter sp. TaxID=3041440 RepID=UPI002A9A8080|nr:2-oxoglutarate dehydrogenase complex dihydrolipoyllysine-residue succinyltransferase [Thermodesulfobacteriota bacterium]